MLPQPTNELASQLRDRLRSGQRLLFITGAGLSAESGLPTYRGLGGLYEHSGTEDGIPIERALSGPVFKLRPEVTWRHIAAIEQAVRGATYNAAHRIIASLERDFEVVVLTQNIDGFHGAAGSTRIIDIHGDCHKLLCTQCEFAETRQDYVGLAIPPLCPKCAAVLRPRVVLFEEALPADKLSMLEVELNSGFDAYFSVGTSSLFPYITEPMIDAKRRGRLTIEINPGQTSLSPSMDVKFSCGAVEAMSAIFEGYV